jgi:hypothetical protein
MCRLPPTDPQPEVEERRGKMRKLLIVAVAAGLMVGLVASPVSADKPAEFTDSVMFFDIDACTGVGMEITLEAQVFVHEGHNNNLTGRLKRTGSTTSGYTMKNGIETFTETRGVSRGHFTDIWMAEDGRKMSASGVFVFNVNTGEQKVDKFTLRCLGGETILP